MNARYILLLQRQFDEALSERETYELQGFLAGNESAARLAENVRKLIDECEQMDPPEIFKPQDEKLLLIEIVSSLRKTKSKSWLDALSNLIPKKTQEQKNTREQKNTDELAILRSKRKDNRNIDRDADALASMRSKFSPAPDSVPSDFVQQTSLAEAIKNKLQQNKHDIESNWEAPPQPKTQSWDWADEPAVESPTNLPPPQTTTQAAELDHFASDMRSADPTKSADPLPPQVSSPDFSANYIMPIEPKKPTQFNPAAIPVDEIIAHVSQIFSDREPIVPIENDPLGATSGVYPQIREEDLRIARNARLSTASDTIEQSGQIKSIGKFLLDKHSEAAIGALNLHSPEIANARILSDAEAQALQDCLTPIQKQDGVAGCVIVGYDGMIITSTLPPEADKDAFSAWALFTYINTHELVQVVGHNRLRQLVSKTGKGYLLLADFGQGLLVAVSDNAATEAIVPLMKSVRKVTAA